MKLSDNQLDKSSLSKLGEEACRLFIARDFHGLATAFSYAIAYDRDIASAIEADFEHCLSDRATSHNEQPLTIDSVTVKNFQPNDTGLLSVVECVLQVDKKVRVLIEFIAAKNGENINLYLEDMNAMT